METNPLVTVNILSFNRKDELRNTLTKVYEQDYKNIEVIVVDNASSDGSSEMVKNEFPEVHLIQLEKNIGIAGWNEGFKVAKGEYVLVLDDDSYPKEKTLLKVSIKLFTEKTTAVLAYKIWNTQKQIFENDIFLDSISPHFVGCGAMIKKESFDHTGMFSDFLFIYEHERDFTIKLYDKGYNIEYVPELTIIHNASAVHRSIKRRNYYFTRNYLIILFLYFNLYKVFFRMIRISAGRMASGICQGGFLSTLNGILSFLFLIPKLLLIRNPVSKQTQKLFGYGNFAGGFHFKEYDWSN